MPYTIPFNYLVLVSFLSNVLVYSLNKQSISYITFVSSFRRHFWLVGWRGVDPRRISERGMVVSWRLSVWCWSILSSLRYAQTKRKPHTDHSQSGLCLLWYRGFVEVCLCLWNQLQNAVLVTITKEWCPFLFVPYPVEFSFHWYWERRHQLCKSLLLLCALLLPFLRSISTTKMRFFKLWTSFGIFPQLFWMNKVHVSLWQCVRARIKLAFSHYSRDSSNF
jgi:hypothetical protein